MECYTRSHELPHGILCRPHVILHLKVEYHMKSHELPLGILCQPHVIFCLEVQHHTRSHELHHGILCQHHVVMYFEILQIEITAGPPSATLSKRAVLRHNVC